MNSTPTTGRGIPPPRLEDDVSDDDDDDDDDDEEEEEDKYCCCCGIIRESERVGHSGRGNNSHIPLPKLIQ